jgi:hypothetical protein
MWIGTIFTWIPVSLSFFSMFAIMSGFLSLSPFFWMNVRFDEILRMNRAKQGRGILIWDMCLWIHETREISRRSFTVKITRGKCIYIHKAIGSSPNWCVLVGREEA